jgi:hypothetical protein
MVEFSYNCYQHLLSNHEKYSFLAPVVNALKIAESFTCDENKEFFREKIVHPINVFLLGLYLYHKCEFIRTQIDNEIVKTTPIIVIPKNVQESLGISQFQYSRGSIFGEFLFRWRILALCHDLGSPSSLYQSDLNEFDRFLSQITRTLNLTSIRFDELWGYSNLNGRLIQQFNKKIPEVDLDEYIQFQLSNPIKNVKYNHGLFGALLFYYLMEKLYQKKLMDKPYQKKPNFCLEQEGSGKVLWVRKTLSHQILDISFAIAIHDLDSYEENFIKNTQDYRIYDFQKRPFAALLKLADILQEWNKPKIEEIQGWNMSVELDIYIKNNKIIVEKIEEEKGRKIAYTIQNYFNPTNFLIIK